MRKKRLGAAAVILSMTVAVCGTVAYLQNATETVVNTFSSDKSISIQLREPDWDGYDFKVPDAQYPCGVSAIDGNDTSLGLVQAMEYVPGQEIPKNPQVKNNGTKEESVYTAIGIAYYEVAADGTEKQLFYENFKEKFLAEAGITFGSDWTLMEEKEGQQLYLYGSRESGTVLETGMITSPLFENVPLSDNLKSNENGQMPQFKIRVTAYAVQAANIEASAASQMLSAFIDTCK